MSSMVTKLSLKLLPRVVTQPVSRTVHNFGNGDLLSSVFGRRPIAGLVKKYRTASNHTSASLSNSFLTPYFRKRNLCCGTRSFQNLGNLATKTSCCGIKNVHFLALKYCSRQQLNCRQKFASESDSASIQNTLSLRNPSIEAYLRHLVGEYRCINRQLNDEHNVADGRRQKQLRRRLNELTPLVGKMEEWTNKEAELAEIEKLISAASTTAQDQEMKELAILEKEECLQDSEILEKQILTLLAPPDKTDNSDIIIEFSAGVGGQEAMLFTTDMFEMYRRFAAYKNWGFEKLEYSPTELGGLRHATVSITGEGAYKLMKHEAGVHRVQRVPKTEKTGRIHTSTMTIAVLPQPTEIDLKLDPKDLRIETKKASGAGGQHVNTTDSAVRIVHLPTGVMAESQQERSQIRNRTIAMTMLHAKIYSALLEKREAAERTARRSQIGSAGRSEKIRTYNFQQDRVTDHRIGQSIFDVEGFLSGGQRLDEMIFSLVKEEEVEAIMRLVEDFIELQKEDIRK